MGRLLLSIIQEVDIYHVVDLFPVCETKTTNN